MIAVRDFEPGSPFPTFDASRAGSNTLAALRLLLGQVVSAGDDAASLAATLLGNVNRELTARSHSATTRVFGAEGGEQR